MASNPPQIVLLHIPCWLEFVCRVGDKREVLEAGLAQYAVDGKREAYSRLISHIFRLAGQPLKRTRRSAPDDACKGGPEAAPGLLKASFLPFLSFDQKHLLGGMWLGRSLRCGHRLLARVQTAQGTPARRSCKEAKEVGE